MASATIRTVKPPPSLEPLSVKIEGDEGNRVGDPVIAWVAITNESDGNLKLMNLSVDVSPSANSSFGSARPCTLPGDGEVELMPAQMFRMACKFPIQAEAAEPLKDGAASDATQASDSKSDQLRDAASGWSGNWVTRVLDAHLRFEVTTEFEHLSTNKQDTRRFYPAMVVKAVDYSVFIGGVAGAMLLALFVLAERVLKNPDVRERWVRNLLVTMLMGLRGGVLAVIALLIGKTTQGVGSPVSLSVTDFTGGVLIGLFSYPLASWISSTLKLEGVFVQASGAKEQAPADPAPQARLR